MFLIEETEDDYNNITVPYLTNTAFNIQVEDQFIFQLYLFYDCPFILGRKKGSISFSFVINAH